MMKNRGVESDEDEDEKVDNDDDVLPAGSEENCSTIEEHKKPPTESLYSKTNNGRKNS